MGARAQNSQGFVKELGQKQLAKQRKRQKFPTGGSSRGNGNYRDSIEPPHPREKTSQRVPSVLS
jgi:hypothetical protein